MNFLELIKQVVAGLRSLAPATHSRAIVPSDTATLSHPVRAVMVGSDGVVVGTLRSDEPVMMATSAAVAAGGSGYSVNDVLSLVGGTKIIGATFSVTGVTGGAVTGVSVSAAGKYSLAAGPATPTTSGAGSGCKLTVTWAIDSYAVTHALKAGVVYPLEFSEIRATGTTATGIVALW